MKLRVISGELKGRYIIIGDPVDYRPTQERVRESVAEIVKRRVRGAAAADVCAGSGAFGFEMISRGAASVDFVENDKRKIAAIADNADRLDVKNKARIIRDDVHKFIDGRHQKTKLGDARNYDIIFYDPPYDAGDLSALVPKLITLLNDGGMLIYERRRRHGEKKTADTEGKESIIDARIYSDTVVEFYSKDNDKNADSIVPGDV